MKARGAAPTEGPAARPRPFALMLGLLTSAALLVGLAIGWLVGRRQGKAELLAYRQGVLDTETKTTCWVRSQVPPC